LLPREFLILGKS